jgi:pimeloyl-ACP methyl ester carboxylesterase
VLLIVGENDPMGPRASAIIAEQLPAADLVVVVPGCGHWVHVDQPAAVLEAFDRWTPRLVR